MYIFNSSFKRQTAVDWPQSENSNLKLRKSKSLPNSGISELTREKFPIVANEGESTSEKNTKKKKIGKMSKKAKVVSNAKIFLQKKS